MARHRNEFLVFKRYHQGPGKGKNEQYQKITLYYGQYDILLKHWWRVHVLVERLGITTEQCSHPRQLPPTPEGFRGSLLIVVFYSWEVTKLLQICRKKSRAMTSILWISG